MDGFLTAGSSCRASSPLLSCKAGFSPFLHFLLLCWLHSRSVQPADLRTSWPVDAEVICFRPCLTPCDQTSVFHLGTSPIIHWEDNEQRSHSRTCYQKSGHRAMGRKFNHFQQCSLKKVWNYSKPLCLPLTRLWVTAIGLRKQCSLERPSESLLSTSS